MYFLTGKAMPRRQFMQGMSATIALPYLDAMIPTGRGAFGNAKEAPRLVAIEMVHGAAGCNEWGAKMNMWSPAATGRQYDLSPTALSQHLARMRDLQLVETRREGQTIYYRLVSPEVTAILQTLYGLYCAPAPPDAPPPKRGRGASRA